MKKKKKKKKKGGNNKIDDRFFWSHPKSQNQSPPKMYQHQLELQSGEYLAQRDKRKYTYMYHHNYAGGYGIVV